MKLLRLETITFSDAMLSDKRCVMLRFVAVLEAVQVHIMNDLEDQYRLTPPPPHHPQGFLPRIFCKLQKKEHGKKCVHDSRKLLKVYTGCDERLVTGVM